MESDKEVVKLKKPLRTDFSHLKMLFTEKRKPQLTCNI